MIHLEDITPINWRANLSVSDEQKTYVSDTYRIMARAYAYREHRSQVKIICDDETPVGMLMFYDCDELDGYDISQVLIDHRYQRKGYGIQATKLVLDWMKKDNKYNKVFLCYMDGNKAARELYTKLGFKHTGECDEDEVIMVLNL